MTTNIGIMFIGKTNNMIDYLTIRFLAPVILQFRVKYLKSGYEVFNECIILFTTQETYAENISRNFEFLLSSLFL